VASKFELGSSNFELGSSNSVKKSKVGTDAVATLNND
jgi:hypothetical protein